MQNNSLSVRFERRMKIIMTEYTRTIPLGAAAVSIINVGDIRLKLAKTLNVPESEWRPRYGEIFEQAFIFPSQCVHIALPEASVLVDAGDFALSFPPDSPYFQPGYQPPPGVIAQLREKGIHPGDITHLIITHAHFLVIVLIKETASAPDEAAASAIGRKSLALGESFTMTGRV